MPDTAGAPIINAEPPPASSAPSNPVPPSAMCSAKTPDKGQTCPRCKGVINTDTVMLSQIKVGKPDKLNNRIEEILWLGENYTIYRSTNGVYIHFSDCHEDERIQRACYGDISDILCQLRFLTGTMAKSRFWSAGRNPVNYYEHQIAQAMVMTMEGKADKARDLLTPVLEMAVGRVTNENRIRYLLACIVAGLVVGSIAGLSYVLWPAGAHTPYLLAAIFGVAGAVLSIAMRVQNLELVPCKESSMNVVMGVLRVVIGFSAGAFLLLLLHGTFVSDSA